MDVYLEQLQSEDGELRLRALLALVEEGDRRHLPTLALLARTDRYEHITVTGFGGASEQPSHESTWNFVAASQAMAGIYRRHGIRPAELARLVHALDGPTSWPSDAWLASSILRELGAASLPALTAALKRLAPLVRANAARVLAEMGPLAHPILEQALRHRDPAVRANALRGLLHRTPTAADLPRLSALWRDPSAAVRLAVLEHIARADLMRLAEEEARVWFSQTSTLLSRGLTDSDEGVRRQALEGLLRVQPRTDLTSPLRARQLIDRYGLRVRADQLAPLLSDPSLPIQRLALKLARHVDPAPLATTLGELVRNPELEVSLAAVRLLHQGQRLFWLELLHSEGRLEMRRLIAELGTTTSPHPSNHVGLLISATRLLSGEPDSVLKRLLIAYLLREGRKELAWSDGWRPSRWHGLALLLYNLRGDSQVGLQAAELYTHAEAQHQAAYTALLSGSPSRAQIEELRLCGDGRALPVLERVAAAHLTEWSDRGGDDNGAGGLPYPEVAYPLTPLALAAIDSILARLQPPLTTPPPNALTPELEGIFRAALQREIRGQLQLPERLRFDRVYVVLRDGLEGEDEPRRARSVRVLLGYAGEPFLDFFEQAEDYSRHCRLDVRGVLRSLEDFRNQWGRTVYPDDPERTERELRQAEAANTRLHALLRQKGFV